MAVNTIIAIIKQMEIVYRLMRPTWGIEGYIEESPETTLVVSMSDGNCEFDYRSFIASDGANGVKSVMAAFANCDEQLLCLIRRGRIQRAEELINRCSKGRPVSFEYRGRVLEVKLGSKSIEYDADRDLYSTEGVVINDIEEHLLCVAGAVGELHGVAEKIVAGLEEFSERLQDPNAGVLICARQRMDAENFFRKLRNDIARGRMTGVVSKDVDEGELDDMILGLAKVLLGGDWECEILS